MDIALACGGTGGHLYPGLATARVLRERGHTVTLWLAGRHVESTMEDRWVGRTVSVPASGFSKKAGLHWVSTATTLAQAVWVSRRLMRAHRPDILCGMGSYASIGPGLAAQTLGIPIVLHEANAIAGRAVSLLARFAVRVGVAFEAAAATLPEGKAVLTGLPIAHDLAQRFDDESRYADRLTILVMGGSQGAHRLNTIIPVAMRRLQADGLPVQVIHIAGAHDAGTVRAQYAAGGVDHEVFEFFPEMAKLYHVADLAICRSGAASCWELALCGLPAMLIPLPEARRNHQYLNAREMESRGCATVLEQNQLTVDAVTNYIYFCLEHPEKLERMREAARGFAIEDGASRLADLVERSAQSA